MIKCGATDLFDLMTYKYLEDKLDFFSYIKSKHM